MRGNTELFQTARFVPICPTPGDMELRLAQRHPQLITYLTRVESLTKLLNDRSAQPKYLGEAA